MYEEEVNDDVGTNELSEQSQVNDTTEDDVAPVKLHIHLLAAFYLDNSATTSTSTDSRVLMSNGFKRTSKLHINRIFDIDDILVFQEVDMQFTEEKIEAAKEPMVDEIGLAQTVVQFAGIRGGSLIKYLCNIGSQVKAITLIKKVNNITPALLVSSSYNLLISSRFSSTNMSRSSCSYTSLK